ncbi:MAG TPA: hypothetical protein VK173_10615, partial [Lacibacter sp.]|nr:hypothetical protein [Lacibacter sp.]
LACDVSKIDKYHIDATSIRQTRVTSGSPKIQKLVKELQCSKLDLTSLADIEFEGKIFYQIKDLDYGNYLVIDEAGVVYELTHDPYEITFVHKNIREYVTGLSNASA